jgi:hypothetical protein
MAKPNTIELPGCEQISTVGRHLPPVIHVQNAPNHFLNMSPRWGLDFIDSGFYKQVAPDGA